MWEAPEYIKDVILKLLSGHTNKRSYWEHIQLTTMNSVSGTSSVAFDTVTGNATMESGSVTLLDMCVMTNISSPQVLLKCQALCNDPTWNANLSLLHSTVCSTLPITPRTPKQPSAMRLAMYFMHVYFMPVIILVGVLGNALSCVVLLGTHMRQQSSSIYLASLSIADTGFLMTLFIVWLAWVDVDLMHRPGWCQLTVFIAYISAFLSVWSVVSFTTERYIAVWHPFHRNIVCSAKRAKIIIICLTVFAFCLYCPSLWTTTVITVKGRYRCVPEEDLMHIGNALMNVDIIITLVIPALLIVPLNICIVIKIYQTLKSNQHLHESLSVHGKLTDPKLQCNNADHDSVVVSSSSDRYVNNNAQLAKESRLLKNKPKKDFRGLKRSGTCQSTASNRSDKSIKGNSTPQSAMQRRADSQLKTTRTLVLISSCFVLLNAPSHAFKIYAFIQTLRGKTYSTTSANARGQEAVQLLYYINFAINFFLYSACAQRFRKTIKRMFKRMRYALVCCNGQGCRSCSSGSNSYQDQIFIQEVGKHCSPCRGTHKQTALWFVS